jgi:FKBP-type peptidyl-prolyl cis-trans isomerase
MESNMKNSLIGSGALCATILSGTLLLSGATLQAAPKTKSKPSRSKLMMPARARGLLVHDTKKGKGAVAQSGMEVTVHYRGRLRNGTIFDESYKRGQPFTFTLGAGQVIKGWDQGVAGMRVGGKRRLTIAPNLAYGPQGSPPVIPPNATLIFDVELLKVARV